MIKRLRGYLLTGLVFWLPIFVTVIVISAVLEWLDRIEAFLPESYRPSTILGYSIPGFGVIFALLLFIITGLLVTNWLGQKFVNWGEALLHRIPLVRAIYQTTKQIIQALMMSDGQAFRQVVMVEFPRKDCWSLAFQTGEVKTSENETLYTVFIPATPNPTSGFFLMLPEHEIKHLDISVEEALKMILSLGAIRKPLFNSKN